MWFEGPKFLWEQKPSWERDHIAEEINPDDAYTKEEVFGNRTEVKTDTLETPETRFSSWNNIRRMFSLVLKFKTNLLTKAFPKRDKAEQDQQIKTGEQLLSIAEIKIAGKKIIKLTQNRVFAEEISSLGSANNKRLKKSNKRTNFIH